MYVCYRRIIVEGVLCCKEFLKLISMFMTFHVTLLSATFFVYTVITKETWKYLEIERTLSSPLHMYYEYLQHYELLNISENAPHHFSYVS